jgi:hypothetical protein
MRFKKKRQEQNLSLTTTTSSFGREVSFPLEILIFVPATILLAALSSVVDRNRWQCWQCWQASSVK